MKFKTALLLTVFLILSSCTTTNVSRFARAVEELSSSTTKAYENVNKTTIQRRIVTIAVTPETLVSPEAFEPVLDDKNLSIRMELLYNLGSYGSALKELSETDFRKDVEDACQDLYNSLSKLNETCRKVGLEQISDKDLSIIASVINAFGNSLIEYNRHKAIKTIVVKTDPVIQKACGVLSTELPTFSTFVESNLNTTEMEMLTAYKKEAPKLSFLERLEYLKTIHKVHETRIQIKPFFETIAKATEAIAKAHAEQKKALELNEEMTPQLKAMVKELEDLCRNSRKFSKNLGKDENP